jgi:hypothetical protein
MGNEKTTQESLTEGIQHVLQRALETGFEPPLYIAVVARNGYSMVVCMTPNEGVGLDATTLCESDADGQMRLPIHMMVTDSTGVGAVHLLIDGDGQRSISEMN